MREEAQAQDEVRLNECKMLSGSWEDEGSDPAQMTDKRMCE